MSVKLIYGHTIAQIYCRDLLALHKNISDKTLACKHNDVRVVVVGEICKAAVQQMILEVERTVMS